MLRFARIGLLVLVVPLSCARSALPETTGDESATAGGRALPPPQSSWEPEAGCTPCGEGLSAQKSLRCLCRTLRCPSDLDQALSVAGGYAALGTGCGHSWFVQRMGRGYDLLVFQRGSGAIVYAQHAMGDAGVACVDGSEALVIEGGRVPQCADEQMVWCKFPHVDYSIGLGELDAAKTCDERALR